MHLKPLFLQFLLFFMLFIPLLNVSALDSGLNLDDAINYALDYNLSLKKTEIDLAASSYSERNLWAEIFPTINASASVGYRNYMFSEPPRVPYTNPNYSVGLGVNLGLNAGIPYIMKNIKLAHQVNILRYKMLKISFLFK